MSLEKVEIIILDERAEIPKRATDGSAGYDVKAIADEPITLLCGERKLIPTGLSICIHNPEYALFLLPRSGLGHKNGIVLGNLVGLIDSDYQGQLMVSLWNSGLEPFTIKHGDAIAQMVFKKVEHPEFEQVTEFSSTTERGSGGFGSTTRLTTQLELPLEYKLEVEVGKLYTNGKNERVLIVGKSRALDYPYLGDNGGAYSITGQHIETKDASFNLVDEFLAFGH
jgi:dUTP pyrophosphatase